MVSLTVRLAHPILGGMMVRKPSGQPMSSLTFMIVVVVGMLALPFLSRLGGFLTQMYVTALMFVAGGYSIWKTYRTFRNAPRLVQMSNTLYVTFIAGLIIVVYLSLVF
jgi:hypothetical protein